MYAVAEKRGDSFRCQCKANLWDSECLHVKLAKIYQTNKSLFPVKATTIQGRTHLLEANVAHGNRKQVYVVISTSNGRYCEFAYYLFVCLHTYL